MATQKKKTSAGTKNNKKVVAKAPAAKATAAKKVVAKKPAAKAPAKASALKKSVPTKKVAPKVSPAKTSKPTAKKAEVKKAPAKKVASAAKAVKAPAKVEKTKKAAPKATNSKAVSKATKAPIAKKSAKPVAKKATKVAAPKKAAPAKVAPAKVKDTKKATVKAPAPKKAPAKVQPAPAKKSIVSAKKKTASVETKGIPKVDAKPKKQAKSLVVPKTTTDKARKYEPAFTKSVLDSSSEEPQGPSLRYSDNDLNEFRDLISKKLETAKKELGYLQGLITRKDQLGGDDSENRYMTMEDGGLSMEREQLGQMASRQITFIDHLEKALIRIENKTYGICRVTGKLIDKARLRAVPHATLSIEAKMGRAHSNI